MPDTHTIELIQSAKQAGRLALSEAEAAKCLGVSARTVFSLRADGKIGFVKLGGSKSRILYPVSKLERFVAENTQFAAPDGRRIGGAD